MQFPTTDTPARRKLIPGQRARAYLERMVEQGLIEAEDGDTYRITEKGKAAAAQYEGRV